LCRFWNGLVVAKALRASVPELRRYQNRLPCQALVPDLVALVIVPIPPNSARVVSRLAVNSWMASTEGCDTLSGLPKLPNVVSMPSTLTFTLVAPAPGVSHLAPLPTCTTPGTVSGMMLEIRPESPEFLETLRRLVGVSMIRRGARLLPTAADSSCTTAEALSATTTSVDADATSNLRSWRTLRYGSTAKARASSGRNPLASAPRR